MNIFDWINSDDGPKFDDDYQGVTRTDGKRTQHGDRDDERKYAENSIERIKRLDDVLDNERRWKLSQPTKRPVKSQPPYGKHIAGDTVNMPNEFVSPRTATQVDPFGGTPLGYVAPHERGQSGNGLAQLALMLVLFLAAMSALFNG